MIVPVEVQRRVANQVARKWRARGVRSYSYADLYQDACVEIHAAARKYDPNVEGSLEGFLYVHCMRRLQRVVTRQMAPVSARSNADVFALGHTRAVSCEALEKHVDSYDTVEEVYRMQVRERMRSIAAELPEGELALQIALGLCDTRDVTQDTARRKVLYKSVRTLKKHMLEDLTLYRMAREQ